MASSLAMARFDKLDSVASGGFGVVYRARDRRSGEIVAIKCIRSTSHNDADFSREVSALDACSGHPYIVPELGLGPCRVGPAQPIVLRA